MQWAIGRGQETGAVAAPGVARDSPAKVKEAASQFEALLIGEMMKHFRESDSGGEGDQTGASMIEMAEGQFAQVLAARGGLGLSRMIVDGIKKDINKGTGDTP